MEPHKNHRASTIPTAGVLIGGIYRVISPLGSGAMGVVLLALDESLDRRVAIKLVRPEHVQPGFRERFLSEARAMARVNHPNVLSIHAFGTHEDTPYFVMEYVDGQTLDQWMASRRPALPELGLAVRILVGIGHGLQAIHAADTLHRDLKPSNVLLDADLRPRIADLGLAVLRESLDSEIAGTPEYMAPETAVGGVQDPALRTRADIYALGCVAYEIFTGKPPFEAERVMQLLYKHVTEPVERPSIRRTDLPPALDDVLLHALAKDPAQRTPSAEAFVQALVSAASGNPEPVRILVAEDDEGFRTVLMMALSKEFPQAQIEAVADGRAALDAFDRRAPSVAIIDLVMPGLDGLELTGLLRAREATLDVPIIVLTGTGGPKEWRRLSTMGADRFLIKPVHLDDVVAAVRSALRQRSSLTPASTRNV